jgi:hypothetical protein
MAHSENVPDSTLSKFLKRLRRAIYYCLSVRANRF